MIAGIRYPDVYTAYPRFVPWSEIKEIGIYETESNYAIGVTLKTGGDVDLVVLRDLARIERAFDEIVDEAEQHGTVIEIAKPLPVDNGPCMHEAERVAYAGDRQILYRFCKYRQGLHALKCPTSGRPCSVMRDRAVWGDNLP